MRIENQGEEYLKVNLAQEGALDYDVIKQIKHAECVLPFQLMEEKNTILYHKGRDISLLEFFNLKTLTFQETREIILSVIACFEQVEKAGGNTANILDNLYHVYIDPVTQAVHVVYCPVVLELAPDNFRNMMKNILFAMNTQDAEMVLGTMAGALGEIPRRENEPLFLKEKLQQVTSNVKIIEKKVEVDRIVEKVIEKPKQVKSHVGRNYLTYTLLYFFSMIVLPAVCSNLVSETLMAKPAILNVLLYLLALMVSGIITTYREKNRKDEKIVVTMQPKKKEE